MKKVILLMFVLSIFACKKTRDYNSTIVSMNTTSEGYYIRKAKICNQLDGIAAWGTDVYDNNDCYEAEIVCYPAGTFSHVNGFSCRIINMKKA